MGLMPKRVKYRKSQRGKLKGNATRGTAVSYGEYGLMALEGGWLTDRQIEAGRVASSHFLGGTGKMYSRVFPWKPISGKPLEVRMGSGKGEVEYWAETVRPGQVLFEVGGTTETVAKEALARMAHKLPFRCKFVKRRQSV